MGADHLHETQALHPRRAIPDLEDWGETTEVRLEVDHDDAREPED